MVGIGLDFDLYLGFGTFEDYDFNKVKPCIEKEFSEIFPVIVEERQPLVVLSLLRIILYFIVFAHMAIVLLFKIKNRFRKEHG
jgi:hypothetical protein